MVGLVGIALTRSKQRKRVQLFTSQHHHQSLSRLGPDGLPDLVNIWRLSPSGEDEFCNCTSSKKISRQSTKFFRQSKKVALVISD